MKPETKLKLLSAALLVAGVISFTWGVTYLITYDWDKLKTTPTTVQVMPPPSCTCYCGEEAKPIEGGVK